MRRWASVVMVTIGLAAWADPAPATQHQWWKEKPESRLDQKVVDPSGKTAARLKWDDGYIEVRAEATADKRLAVNKAHERSLARTAARHLGYLKLAEIVDGVAIDGVTVVKNAIVQDQTVRSTVQGTVRGARVISEQVADLPDGSALAEVIVGLRLRGGGSLTTSVRAWAAGRPTDAYAGDTGFRVNDAYTGLIIDASDAGFSPALTPRLIEEGTSKVVFGPHMVQPAIFAQEGPLGYAATISEARRSGRAGVNPLIVRAVNASGSHKGDLLVSRKDAERVLGADRTGSVLGRAAIVIVQGKERHELSAVPGRRYAVVLSVDDYPQSAPGAPRPLNFAVRDARALVQVLTRTGGFTPATVTVLEDQAATRDRIMAALRSLAARLREEDSVVLFFSGHGSIGPGPDGRPHYYLLPRDGRLTDLVSTALMDEHLEELIGQFVAREVVVILDACYSGGGSGILRARGVNNPGAAAPPARPVIEASVGRIVLSASRPDQPAFEDDQRGGIFTSFLIEGLAGAADLNGDGAINVLELYQYVSPLVREYTRQHHHQEQTPVLEVRSLAGDIVLGRRP